MKTFRYRFLTLALCLLLGLGLFPQQAAASVFGEIDAEKAILVDLHNDTILFEKNMHQRHPPASLTKIMTGLLIVEAIEHGELEMDTVIPCSSSAIADLDKYSSTQNILPGERLTVEQLLYALLVPSANEAGNILAEALCGTVPNFVERMNQRAAELDMVYTNFANPHGLHSENQYSTPYDLYLLTKEALSHSIFQTIVSTASYTIPATNLSDERAFYSTNALITTAKYPFYRLSSAIGVKTGYLPESGYCLASAAQGEGRTLVSIVLGADTKVLASGDVDRAQFRESRRLLDWGLSSFDLETILDPSGYLTEVKVKNGKNVAHVLASPATAVEAILSTRFDPTLLDLDSTLLRESARAPIAKGDVLGSITVTYDGMDYGAVPLIAVADVELSYPRLLLSTITGVLSNGWVLLAAALFIIGAVLVQLARIRRSTARRAKEKEKSSRAKRKQQKKSR